MKTKAFNLIAPFLAVLSSCKVTQTVNQTAVLSSQPGAVSLTQSSAVSKSGASMSSASIAIANSGATASASSSATVATSHTKKSEPVLMSAKSAVIVDPVGRWTGNDQGDFVAIHFGNAGDVKYTNPDGSVSGTWQLLRDGTVQITLRNAGANFVFTSGHSGTLLLGAKRISVVR